MKEGKVLIIFINNKYSTYEIITLLRRYINNQDSVTYNSLFEPVIIDVRQSLGNELNRE